MPSSRASMRSATEDGTIRAPSQRGSVPRLRFPRAHWSSSCRPRSLRRVGRAGSGARHARWPVARAGQRSCSLGSKRSAGRATRYLDSISRGGRCRSRYGDARALGSSLGRDQPRVRRTRRKVREEAGFLTRTPRKSPGSSWQKPSPSRRFQLRRSEKNLPSSHLRCVARRRRRRRERQNARNSPENSRRSPGFCRRHQPTSGTSSGSIVMPVADASTIVA